MKSSKVLRKILRLNRNKYFEVHLQIVNALLPVKLTPKEVEVLAAFMSLDGDIAMDRFGTTARKMIKKLLHLSDGGLGNYMKSFKDKKFIVATEDGMEIINPILNASMEEQNYIIRLVNMEA